MGGYEDRGEGGGAVSDREAMYDEHISPLMTEIIALCKEHDIPVVASFDLQCDDDPGLMCTTAILPDHAQDCLVRALRIMREPSHVAFTITTIKDPQ